MECWCGEKFHPISQFNSALIHQLTHISESLHDIWETLDSRAKE